MTDPVRKPDAFFPGADEQPANEPTDKEVRSEPLGDEGMRVDQEPNGPESLGGGRTPDPDTPPNLAAGGGAP